MMVSICRKCAGLVCGDQRQIERTRALRSHVVLHERLPVGILVGSGVARKWGRSHAWLPQLDLIVGAADKIVIGLEHPRAPTPRRRRYGNVGGRGAKREVNRVAVPEVR